MRTTEQRFLSSTLAAYGSQFGRTALRLVADLTLARLVLPEGHGIFALAWSVVVIAGLCRDLGLPYELVRDARRPYGAVFRWELWAGLLTTLLVIAGSPLFAGMDPALPAVLRWLSIYILFDALAVVPKLYFERELEVGRLVGPELWRGATVSVLAIALAARGAGVWSFVAGEIAGAALYALLLWRRAHGRLRLDSSRGLTADLLRKSSLLFLIALAANSTPFVGRFIIEGFSGTFMVGQYEKAYLWALRLQILVLPAFMRVLYPALVEYRSDRRRSLGAYRLGTVGIVALEVLAAYFLFFNADTVMLRILAGKNWQPAAELLRILCWVPLLDPWSRLGGELLKSRHEDRLWLAITGLNLACLLVFGVIFTRAFGPSGMAWANYLLLGNLLMAWRMHQICGPDFWSLTSDLVFIYLLPLPLFLAVVWFFPAFTWARLAASVAAAGLGAAAIFWRLRPPYREFFSVSAGEAS